MYANITGVHCIFIRHLQGIGNISLSQYAVTWRYRTRYAMDMLAKSFQLADYRFGSMSVENSMLHWLQMQKPVI